MRAIQLSALAGVLLAASMATAQFFPPPLLPPPLFVPPPPPIFRPLRPRLFCPPRVSYSYSYQSYYAAPSPYGIYYNPGASYIDYYLPPIQFPAELSYGPQAVQRFMGAAPDIPLDAAPAPVVAYEAERPADEGLAERVRDSNPETRRKARAIRDVGDSFFRRQRYHEALQQYKSASRLAPDVGEFYFRQGHALIATNRYELAAEAFQRGMEIDPAWLEAAAETGFSLDELYADTPASKAAHLDALSKHILDGGESADAWFDLGVFLYFDGQPERAQKFFARAMELGDGPLEYMRPFLAGAAGGDDTET